ncbi:putative amino acid transporter PAT1 [Aeromonas phage AhSzq-1]|uniref:Putative amino acid transporter PAT1 n=1 Tax=Aeromonas phage AhSzq-1 TaxID=2138298 RepID=A0A2R4ALI1_9CAUD|nr:putative amino acid transporter PAT1 [Aeromonas phage AhSzq-1]AVR75910.1 putative amino acid transporter PAT1 [Aeromonas phage AhSzq-1]
MAKYLIVLLLILVGTPAHAILKDCSTYPLITSAEREVIKKAMVYESKTSPQWKKLTTKQRIEVCRELAKTLRRLK